MGKITFSNGVTMNFDGQPTSADIEEMSNVALQQKPIESPPLQFKSIKEAQDANAKAQKDVRIAQSEASPLGVISKGLDMATAPALNTSLAGLPEIISQKLTGKPFVPPDAQMKGLSSAVGFMEGLPNLAARGAAGLVGKGIGLMSKIGRASAGGAAAVASNLPSPSESPTLKDAALKVGENALTGAIAGPVLEGATSKAIDMVPKPIADRIFNLYNEAIGTKIKSPVEASTIKASKVNVVKTISDNLPDIKLPNPDTGVLESRIPQTREENLQAYQQAKDLVWKNNVTKLSAGATAKGAQIDLPSLVDKSLAEAKANIGSVALKANPELAASLDKEAAKIKAVGDIDPTKSQEYLKYLNDQISILRKSGQAVDYSTKDLLSSLRYKLANETDNVIEKTLGQSGYGDARKQYSDLRGAQNEILGAANKYYKQSAGGGFVHPIVDLWSLEELLQSGGHALMGSPGAAALNLGRAATIKGASKLVDFMRSPDRKISQMYELAAKYNRPFKPIKSQTNNSNPTGNRQLLLPAPTLSQPVLPTEIAPTTAQSIRPIMESKYEGPHVKAQSIQEPILMPKQPTQREMDIVNSKDPKDFRERNLILKRYGIYKGVKK